MKIATFTIPQQNARIALPINHHIDFLTTSDIRFCQAQGNYTELHLTNGKRCIASANLATVAKKLQPYGFVIIHKSCLVNGEHVKSLCQKPPPKIILDNDDELIIARRRKPAIMKALFPKDALTD